MLAIPLFFIFLFQFASGQVFFPISFWLPKTVAMSAIPDTDGPQNVSVSRTTLITNAKILDCTATYFSATSSNLTVMSLANITFSGTFPSCSVSLLTTVNSGTSNIVVTYKNEYNQIATTSFIFTAYQKPVMAFSFRKIVKDYLGASMRVRRISDNVETDIGFDGSGNFDLAAYNTFKGASSVTVKTWYDQSGNSYNAVQTTTANQPTITITGFNGAPQVEFLGTYWFVTTQAQNVLTLNRDVTVFFASKASTVAQNNYGSWNTGNSSDRVSIHINWSDNNLYWDSPGTCCSNSRISANNAANVGVPKVYVFGRNNGIQYVKINGTTVTSRTDSSGTYGAPTTPWYIGWTGADTSLIGNAPLAEYIQFLNGLTDTQVDGITNEEKIYFGL